MRGGTGAIVDYSVLYDNVVRATLWEEVRLLLLSLSLSLSHSVSLSLTPIPPPSSPMYYSQILPLRCLMHCNKSPFLQDNSRIYWPASPSNGFIVDDQERGLFIQRWGDSGDPNFGDLHRYYN